MIKLPAYLDVAHITYSGMCEQRRNGFLFDTEKAKELIPWITQKMTSLEEELEPQLPTRAPLKGELKKMTPPKLQFKKDGEPSKFALS